MQVHHNFDDQLSNQSLPLSETPSQQSNSQYSPQHHLITQLIHLKKPIFIFSECSDFERNEEFIRQEFLKQKILSYNRKQKSLGQLSSKFIQSFQGKDGIILQLDKVTSQMKVQRRRIYDIVNIFESLQVIKKVSKNNYVWRGLLKAVQTIEQIFKNGNEHAFTQKRQKSLENLSARFLKLFIFSKSPISLQQSAKVLMHSEDLKMIKNKIRRFYDIVNVFKSIGIVQKVRMENRKPGFKWMGVIKLQQIISEKNVACSLWRQKQNNQLFANRDNVNNWLANEEKGFFGLELLKRFTLRMFNPQIVRQQASERAQSSGENGCDLHLNII